ncbi:hypothetical protein FRAHR75_230026 [Frankia sp. Hr75.2]|nr:hypothetical protein FRAHR75_230026 [Frankia sp. Hr75.2]
MIINFFQGSQVTAFVVGGSVRSCKPPGPEPYPHFAPPENGGTLRVVERHVVAALSPGNANSQVPVRAISPGFGQI